MYERPSIVKIEIEDLKKLIVAEACPVGVNYVVTCPPNQDYTGRPQ